MMNNMSKKITLKHTIPIPFNGLRLDQALAKLFTDYSRVRFKGWIETGSVTLDGQVMTQVRHKVQGGEQVALDATLEIKTSDQAQAIELDVIYEDDDLLAVNKPAGMVVHPAAGHADNTLLNALLHHAPCLEKLPRAGIIHRIDKDTTGLLVVAKSLPAHTSLVTQLKNRDIHREYRAIVNGVMTRGGTVDAPIARHPRARQRMAVVQSGKPAVSHYRVMERFAGHTLIKVVLDTGRTHQIRVHMTHIGYPLMGDPVYGGRLKLPKGTTPASTDALKNFKRQALHATQLELKHPVSGELMVWQCEMPEDMQIVLDALSASPQP
jgi:23S rRNA pseudouridine1911/1915/1917 synthase